jgi:hypothetical protein
MINWVKKVLCLVSASLLTLAASAAGEGERAKLGDYYAPATATPTTPDSEGFIRRWTILEPIAKNFSSNSMLTDNFLSEVMAEEYFKDQYTVIPVDGSKVKIGKATLLWHALDSKKYFVNLLRFAEGFGKEYFQQMYWAVTIIDCEEDIENVRLAGGVNSGAVWYLNGEEVLRLTNDRDLIVDDCMSRRITLKKGRNILRGAVLNGQGMATFCLRFVDEKGRPVTGYTISSELPKKKK